MAVTGAAGAVGSLAVQLARRAGAAATVYGLVSRPGKAAAVPEGATAVVGRGPELVGRLGAGGGVDLLVDTVGGADLAELVAAVSPGGRIVLVGCTAGRSVDLDLPTLMDRDVSLLPLNLFRNPARTREAVATVLRLIRDGDLHLPLTRFRLEELTSAVESLASGDAVGRVVLVPSPQRHAPALDQLAAVGGGQVAGRRAPDTS